MGQPVILVADDDAADRQRVEDELRRRYAVDYDIRAAASVHDGLDQLAHLRGAEVALVLARQRPAGMQGIALLREMRTLHPGAQRVALISWGEQSSAPLLRGSLLRQIDDWLAEPWRPGDEHFHQAIGSFLYRWSLGSRPRFVAARVVGERWSAPAHRIRDLLSRNSVPFEFVEAGSEEGRLVRLQAGADAAPLPVVVLFDGRVLADPGVADLAGALGVRTSPEPARYDVAVIGAGPAGLAAAVYAASEGLRTAVLEPEAVGGQAGTSSMIRNYLGFPRGISGADLAQRAYEQAWLLGAEFIHARRAVGLRTSGRDRLVFLDDGAGLTCRAVIVATGVTYRRLEIPALDRFLGAGVYYGAAAPEAEAMSGQDVFVVGGANSAGQAALHLARYARAVTLLVRGTSLEAGMSDYLVREIGGTSNVVVRLHSEVAAGDGDDRLRRLTLRNRRTGATEDVDAGGLFVLIGAEPRTDWLPGPVERDGHGYVVTGGGGASGRLFETSVPGVFAVGDVRAGSVKRVASSVGEGAVAVRQVHEYLAGADRR